MGACRNLGPLPLLLALTSCMQYILPHHNVAVRLCAAADSLLGPIAHDARSTLHGHVFRLLSGDTDEVLTGDPSQRPHVEARTRLQRGGPLVPPEAEAVVFFEGAAARELRAFGQYPLASLLIDDSLTVPVGLATVGSYNGPEYRLLLPVTIPLPSRAFVALARASSAVVQLQMDGPIVRITVREPERQNIAALYVVAACAGR